MASNGCNGLTQEKHVKLLKKQRGVLVKMLPDIQTMLEHLKKHFSAYECAEILKQTAQADRAAKFLDVMEFKPVVVYQEFLTVVHALKPDLAVRLEGLEREVSGGSTASSPGSNDSSPRRLGNGNADVASGPPHPMIQSPVQEIGDDFEEDAGIFGLDGPGVGQDHHLSHLSYNDREFLAERLNGDPANRQIFHRFCNAMGVENRLVQSSSRSGNPTAYLIQQLSASKYPNATMLRLSQALNQIGHGNLYHQLQLNHNMPH